MAAETIALSARLQGGLVALKQAAQSEAAVADLVTQAVQQGETLSSSNSAATRTDPSRLLDILV